MNQKSSITKDKTIKRAWHLIDLEGQTLGRVATRIASLLMGKSKTYYTPNLDCGDYVVCVNASKIKVTGQKITDKLYRHHTGFPGGFKEYTLSHLMNQDSRQVITLAVNGMLPKNKLRADRLKRLKVFKTNDHPYGHQFEAKGATESHAE